MLALSFRKRFQIGNIVGVHKPRITEYVTKKSKHSINICSVKLQNYIVTHNSQLIRSISCVSSYMFRLIHRAIFRLVFRVICMYSCWCFESYEISYYR